MEAEAKPLADAMHLKEDAPSIIPRPAPCVTYSGDYAGIRVHVVRNGTCALHNVDNVGTVPAALTTYLALEHIKPDLLISVGTAGGFRKKGASIGDVFIGTATIHHDRRIPIPVRECYSVVCVVVHIAFHIIFVRMQ